jgi:hypothetical protein
MGNKHVQKYGDYTTVKVQSRMSNLETGSSKKLLWSGVRKINQIFMKNSSGGTE